MKYYVDDEVTIQGRWYIITEADGDDYRVEDEDGYGQWVTEEYFD